MVSNFYFKTVVTLFFVALIFYMGHFVNGLIGISLAELSSGKNIFTLENYSGDLYASVIILLNKDVEVIAYYDKVTGKNLSYVGAFGGIGRNFQLHEGETYEIYTSKNLTLRVP